ncbi:MAG: hypothetical protein LUD17_08075 [Bacteroidales bacterium]|nr:hypothetical protein [Bacteroidales bacterium]
MTFKKLLLLLMAITASASLYAQKGMVQVGIEGTGRYYFYGPDYLNDGIVRDDYSAEGKLMPGGKVRLMLNTSDHVRLALAGTLLVGFDKSLTEVSLDMHVFFSKPCRTRAYYIFGAGYGSVPMEGENVDNLITRNCIFANTGIGVDVRLTHFLSLQIEAKAVGTCYSKSFSGDKVHIGVGAECGVGLTYNF